MAISQYGLFDFILFIFSITVSITDYSIEGDCWKGNLVVTYLPDVTQSQFNQFSLTTTSNVLFYNDQLWTEFVWLVQAGSLDEFDAM